MKKGHLQTMQVTFEQICLGERPWTALGNFMNYWYAYAKDRREMLIAAPLLTYDEQSQHHQRWAVFCAASVEWLCRTYSVPCPDWVSHSKYTLSEPWFFHLNERAKARLLQTTPEEFQRRNVFCGDRCFSNKWELIEQLRQRTVQAAAVMAEDPTAMLTGQMKDQSAKPESTPLVHQ